MAKINIADLQPVGFNLLSDDENFLNELSEEQASLTYGGGTPIWILSVGAAALGHQMGRADRADARRK